MYTVLATEWNGRTVVYGPFANVLEAIGAAKILDDIRPKGDCHEIVALTTLVVG